MRLSDASVVIRPRTTWEAMDLGVLLSQRHRRLLMTSWAIVSLPVFALLSLLLWQSPSLAVLLFWWLKPAFEPLPLFILSKALFGETPSLGQALRQWPRLLKSQLLASLTWRRFSLSRSFVLPVVQLEGLGGEARQQRLGVLLQRNAGAARWLTLIGMHLEGALWIGLLVLFYLLLPQQVELDWNWQSLVVAAQQDWLWLEHLTNAFYALVLVIWEPIYVACGFSLYLNRRTELEAWDIELVFRRLRQRLSGVAALLLVSGLLLAMPGQAPWAANPNSSVAGPEAPRLLQQPLTSKAAKDSIQGILDKPPFKNQESVTRYRFGEEQTAKKDAKGKPPGWLKSLLDNLDQNRFGNFAKGLEILLWGLLLSALGWLLWRYRDWLRAFVSRRPLPRKKRPAAIPQQLFGLDVSSQSLPADVAAHAQELWASQPREALGLLYRALLCRLLEDFQLPLSVADTEGQVLERIKALQQPSLEAFSRELTTHWQNMAYGHRVPGADLQAQLCDGWRSLFGPGACA
ncbi:DUF4129 domain-containing protein [Pseudomonas sp. TKO26]|uniref:Protein-glutamine gamma-glutamyltransferase-like C-terminal domain-containing protein n=1 Tax=Pseudomonas saponiphila TaxID=556534 RepID=A0A1H4KEQ4_9PSED|nr:MULTISPECIES: DUF4129 domain-containing protein [Pseudomonas]PYY92383.1 DUF4129 domain-containing protein [Pseudomonas sp. TKO30]PYY94746.1 DUF4129 domain-containing protein [Pseudomonas sp. TKO29]PYY96619.1 DUF4129 domain-containing protein [Pseudomonas sp. TKO26]PYZ02211.1 DUF4129 domain-containing protein [Pseudomonas sp. TKO14]SEB57034.1 protein of unknown function [Pseudomonas saponiphila]